MKIRKNMPLSFTRLVFAKMIVANMFVANVIVASVFVVSLFLVNLPAQDAGVTDSLQNVEEADEPVDLLDRIEADTTGQSSWRNKLGRIFSWGSPAKRGEKAYHDENYEEALQKFLEAKLDHPEDPSLSFNIGNTHYQKRKYDEAIEAYGEALAGSDGKLSASAHYNTGNAYFRKGEHAVQSGDQQGIQHYRSAMAHYKKSLEINPDNEDAKRNIEVVQARIKELLERQEQEQQQQQQDGQQEPPPPPSERAKEVLQRAMQLAKQRQYDEAKALLESIIQEDETAISFQSHVQRIDDIQKILSGEKPTKPQSQDPRAQQQGLGVI